MNDLYFGTIFYHLVNDTLWLIEKQICFERDVAVLLLWYLEIKPLGDK